MAGSSVTAEIDIAATPQEVWDLVMDAERTHEWVTISRGVTRFDPLPLRPGWEMEQRLNIRGVTITVEWKLVEVRPPFKAVYEGRGPARAKAKIINELTERDDGGTHFHYVNEFKAPLGPLGAVASKVMVGGVPQKEADASLAKAKALLEG